MKNVLAVCLVAGLSGCGGVGGSGQLHSEGIKSEVADFLESYLTAIEVRDSALLRTMYVDDGRFEWIEDGKIRYRSAGELLEGLATFPTNSTIHTEISSLETGHVGATGAIIAARFRSVIGEGMSAYEFGGMMTMVLERGPTGWRIVGGHTSSAKQDGR